MEAKETTKPLTQNVALKHGLSLEAKRSSEGERGILNVKNETREEEEECSYRQEQENIDVKVCRLFASKVKIEAIEEQTLAPIMQNAITPDVGETEYSCIGEIGILDMENEAIEKDEGGDIKQETIDVKACNIVVSKVRMKVKGQQDVAPVMQNIALSREHCLENSTSLVEETDQSSEGEIGIFDMESETVEEEDRSYKEKQKNVEDNIFSPVINKGICEQKRQLAAHRSVNSVKKPYKCEECGKTYTLLSCLKNHQRIHSGDLPYKCEECGKTFTRSSLLAVHQRVHSTDKPFVCEECGKAFKRLGDLSVHKNIHSGKLHKCEECGKIFTLPSSLKNHKRIHLGDKPYTCEECGKKFIRPYALAVHKRIHSGNKPFTCEECKKTFKQLSELSIHQRIHSRSKPYKCEECGKAFAQLYNLKVHRQIHAGVKPYVCEECGKTFAQSGSLKVHQRLHSGEKPYMCEQCGKTFTQSGSLASHQRIHSGEKPYVCEECGAAFTQSSSLRSHRLVVHTHRRQ